MAKTVRMPRNAVRIDRNPVRTVPDCCPDAAGTLSGKLRNAVRHPPESGPDQIGIGVRMAPEYAAMGFDLEKDLIRIVLY